MANHCPCCGFSDLKVLGMMETASGRPYIWQWGCQNCRAIVQVARDGSDRLECIPLEPGQEWHHISYDLTVIPPVIEENPHRVWRG
jgi:hypothetical protein